MGAGRGWINPAISGSLPTPFNPISTPPATTAASVPTQTPHMITPPIASIPLPLSLPVSQSMDETDKQGQGDNVKTGETEEKQPIPPGWSEQGDEMNALKPSTVSLLEGERPSQCEMQSEEKPPSVLETENGNANGDEEDDKKGKEKEELIVKTEEGLSLTGTLEPIQLKQETALQEVQREQREQGEQGEQGEISANDMSSSIQDMQQQQQQISSFMPTHPAQIPNSFMPFNHHPYDPSFVSPSQQQQQLLSLQCMPMVKGQENRPSERSSSHSITSDRISSHGVIPTTYPAMNSGMVDGISPLADMQRGSMTQSFNRDSLQWPVFTNSDMTGMNQPPAYPLGMRPSLGSVYMPAEYPIPQGMQSDRPSNEYFGQLSPGLRTSSLGDLTTTMGFFNNPLVRQPNENSDYNWSVFAKQPIPVPTPTPSTFMSAVAPTVDQGMRPGYANDVIYQEDSHSHIGSTNGDGNMNANPQMSTNTNMSTSMSTSARGSGSVEISTNTHPPLSFQQQRKSTLSAEEIQLSTVLTNLRHTQGMRASFSGTSMGVKLANQPNSAHSLTESSDGNPYIPIVPDLVKMPPMANSENSST